MTVSDIVDTVAQHVLRPLPFTQNALEPAISSRTIGFHYGRHHAGYDDTLNKLIAGTELEVLSLKEIVAETTSKAAKIEIFNIASQAWNHAFYWNGLRSNGGGQPPSALKRKIEASLGDVEACEEALAAATENRFHNGWVWLVLDGDTLRVVKTINAHEPLAKGLRPLLTIDVWEHSYYLDFQNRRADYATAVLEKLIDWGFAGDHPDESALERKIARKRPRRCNQSLDLGSYQS